MKIAFVSDGAYPWNVGGIEAIEHTEAKSLAMRHDVHFFSFRWPGASKEFKKDGITYHTSHNITKEKFYRHGRRSIREALIFSLEIIRLYKYKFDVLQANEFPILHIPILWLYCKIRRCKLIIDVAEIWDRNYWTVYLGRFMGNIAYIYANFAIKLGDRYIANSSTTEMKLAQIGISSDKIDIFSPVLDNKLLGRIKASSINNKIIFAGRLIKEKALDEWVEVISKLDRIEKNFSAVIIGEGPERENILQAIKKADLSHKITLRNFYYEKEKHLLYKEFKESKVLLQMSRREGLSMIVLESLALGTPVVLPTYSPIPKEVKSMCIVERKSNIPGKIAEILRSSSKAAYLPNKDNLKMFSISNVNRFYSGIFEKLSCNDNHDTKL